jgi:hypothetical protein
VQKTFGLIAVFIALIMGLCVSCGSRNNIQETIYLSDFPGLFNTDTMIIYGESPSPAELAAADIVSGKLADTGGNIPEVKKAGQAAAGEYKNSNLVLIGTADSNSVLNDVFQTVHSSGITADYPGTNKGILEVMTSIWNPHKCILILAGSDETGLRSGVITLNKDGLKETPMEITDWTEVTGVKFPIDSESEAIKYAQLDFNVIAFVKTLTDNGLTEGYWASFDQVEKFWAVGIFAKNASDIWYEIHFRADGTVIFKSKGVL